MSVDDGQPFSDIEATLKKTCATLREAQVPFLLGGSLASWARGGPETRHDLDLMLKAEDVDRALDALEQAGMRPERPPEEWLVKAWDGDVLVDLIHHPCGLPIDDEVLARGEVISVLSMELTVMALEDVVVTKLNALTEHSLRYEGLLSIARALRERIDWEQVRRRAQDTPFARAFFVLLDGLEIVSVPERPAAAAPPRRGVDVRVVGGTHG
jgi:predicted nucleotidyltransferase